MARAIPQWSFQLPMSGAQADSPHVLSSSLSIASETELPAQAIGKVLLLESNTDRFSPFSLPGLRNLKDGTLKQMLFLVIHPKEDIAK